MRVNRSMFVGLLALVAAVGILGANGYYWWLSKSRQKEALNDGANTHSTTPKPRTVDSLPGQVWNEPELWSSPYRELYRDPEDAPPHHNFPNHITGVEIAQADGFNVVDNPPEQAPAESVPPPLLLPHSPTPIEAPPANDWLNELVKQEFPEATEEERGVWSQELQGLDPKMAREILRMRKSVTGLPSIPRVVTRPHSIQELPPSSLHGPSIEGLVPPPMDLLDTGTSSITERLRPSVAALEEARNVALNNLVNAHTPGFKRMRVVLTERPYDSGPENLTNEFRNTEKPKTVTVGRGVAIACTLLDVSQGAVQETKQPLDMAIEGRGFFQVRVGDRLQFTRFGLCALNEKGELCVIKGGQLCPFEPLITVPKPNDRLSIASDGTVHSIESGEETPQDLGQVLMVRFLNPSRLQPVGNQFYSETKSSGPPEAKIAGADGMGTLLQGFLESSNVSRNEELENFQRIQTHLQLLNQLAGSAIGNVLPGPVARRPPSRAKRTSAETILIPPRALKSFNQLKNQSRNLIEEYLQSERGQSIQRTLGWK